jgi:membrane protein required for colicin V production
LVLNWADWVILIIFAISSLFGLLRGLVKEALSLANWGVALLIAMSFRDRLASLFISYIHTYSLRQLIAFGVLFLTSLLIGGLLIYLMGALIKMTGLSFMDRLLGMVFGFIRGFVLVMAMLILIPPVIAVNHDQWWANSMLIHRLLAFEGWARAMLANVDAFVRPFVRL